MPRRNLGRGALGASSYHKWTEQLFRVELCVVHGRVCRAKGVRWPTKRIMGCTDSYGETVWPDCPSIRQEIFIRRVKSLLRVPCSRDPTR